MRERTIPQDLALRAQLALIGGNEPSSSFVEVRVLDPESRPMPELRRWFPVRDLAATAEYALEIAPSANVYVGAAPRVSEDGTANAVQRSWAVWVDCDSPEAVDRLRRF